MGIVRDRGCNVATWNIAHRRLSKDDAGVFLVAATPLRFYHFTSYDNGNGAAMLMRYASDQAIAHELWDTYAKDLAAEGQGDVRYKGWFYGQFENGETISLEARRVYQVRQDLQNIFPNPYSVIEPSFLSWWKSEIMQKIHMPEIVGTKRKRLFNQLIQGFCSPSVGIRITRSAIEILRREGISGFIKRIRSYS